MSIETGAQATAADVLAAIIVGHTSGNYAGSDEVNKARPHGLGVVPKIVFIIENTCWAIIIGGQALVFSATTTEATHNPSFQTFAVTTPSSTNFYVGNASQYKLSGNGNGYTYYWIAIG